MLSRQDRRCPHVRRRSGMRVEVGKPRITEWRDCRTALPDTIESSLSFQTVLPRLCDPVFSITSHARSFTEYRQELGIRPASRADRFSAFPFAPLRRAAPHRRQDRGTLLRPRCRGRRPGAGASQPEAVSSRRPQGGGRGQTHRGLAGAAPRHRTRLRPPRTHPHRTPPPVGERPTRQVRPGGQAAAEGVAGEVSRPQITRAITAELPDSWCLAAWINSLRRMRL